VNADAEAMRETKIVNFIVEKKLMIWLDAVLIQAALLWTDAAITERAVW
jgi:hypothetical protein